MAGELGGVGRRKEMGLSGGTIYAGSWKSLVRSWAAQYRRGKGDWLAVGGPEKEVREELCGLWRRKALQPLGVHHFLYRYYFLTDSDYNA